MKCINCGTDNNYRERTANNKRCKQCQHPFAFEPKTMGTYKFSDRFFQKVIATISNNNTIFFTRKQLAYALDKKLKTKQVLKQSSMFWVTYVVVNLFFWGFFQNFAIVLIISTITLVSTIANFGKRINNYQIRRRLLYRAILLGIITLVVGIIVSTVIYNSFGVLVISTLIGIWSIYFSYSQFNKITDFPQFTLYKLSEFTEFITSWEQANGAIAKMLTLPSEELFRREEANVSNYSFDKLIVTEENAIAYFLITNNFHLQNNCAILSINGYPTNVFNTILNMARSNPNLIVYAIHNASPRGIRLIDNLSKSEQWFARENITILDLGIAPRQVLKNPQFFIKQASSLATETQQLSPTIKNSLLPEEIAWLNKGNYVELESFSPQKLLRILAKGIRQGNLVPDRDSMIAFDNISSESAIYCAEDFG